MPRCYQVISADGHLETPPDPWVKYVPARWRERAPRLVELPEGGEGWLIEGQPMMRNGQNVSGRGPSKFSGASYFREDGSPNDGCGPPEQRLREQDEDGIDAEVLFPPVFATRFLEGITDRDVYRAMIRAYNTWLAEEYCSVARDRLIGNSVTPVSHLDDALAELRFAAGAGLRSVAFYMFPNGSGFADPSDDRFWEACLELGMAIAPHFGFGEVRPPAGRPGRSTEHQTFAQAICQRAGSHSPVYCMAQLMTAGVFDRFPDIRFFFAESHASWIPWTLQFMDDSHEIHAGAFGRRMQLTPSEYIGKHCYFSIVKDPLAIELADRIPMDNLMWGSDLPHSVGTFPHSRKVLDEMFAGRPDLYDKVVRTTPARYFGLDLESPITETPAG